MTAEIYAKISRPFRRSRALHRMFLLCNYAIPAIFYVSFFLLLLMQIFRDTPMHPSPAFRSLLTAGIPFVLVSLFRKFANRPRPYEALAIDPLIPKQKKGQSFPSRHVFSAFVIAMCWLFYVPPVGMVLLVLSAVLAAVRVVGGVHYVSDVLAGALIGILSGFVGFLAI